MTESKDEQDPRKVLHDIHDSVSKIEKTLPILSDPQPIRWRPSQDEVSGVVLNMIYEEGPISSGEIKEATENAVNVTRTLSALYRAYLINRHQSDGVYRYTISDFGVDVVDGYGEQTEINESEEWENEPSRPWDNTDLNRTQYIALELVSDYQGHPLSRDIEDDYRKSTDTGASEDQCYVSARLTELYEMGYVDRPTEEPFRYWLTESGRSLLD